MDRGRVLHEMLLPRKTIMKRLQLKFTVTINVSTDNVYQTMKRIRTFIKAAVKIEQRNSPDTEINSNMVVENVEWEEMKVKELPF